jgi:hypothetical protein
MPEAPKDGGITDDKGAGAGAEGAGAKTQDAGAGGTTALTAPPKDTKGAGDTGKGKESAKTDQAPAEIALKLPEGFKAGPEVEQFKGWAKEAGLKSEQAQAVFDMHLASQQAQLQAIAEQQTQQRKEWAEALAADKEFGGAKYEENRIIAQKAVTQFAGPEFAKWLNDTGLGDHPELMRTFWKVGKALGEDKPSETGKGAGQPPAADKDAHLKDIYPNSPELFGGEKRPKPQLPAGTGR